MRRRRVKQFVAIVVLAFASNTGIAPRPSATVEPRLAADEGRLATMGRESRLTAVRFNGLHPWVLAGGQLSLSLLALAAFPGRVAAWKAARRSGMMGLSAAAPADGG